MKKFLKLLSASALACIMILSSMVPIIAEEKNISFNVSQDIIIETQFTESDYFLSASVNDSEKKFTILDKSNIEVVSWIFDKNETNNSLMTRSISTYRHKYEVNLPSGTFVNEVALEKGGTNPYYQFNRFMYYNMYVIGDSAYQVVSEGIDVSPTGPGGNNWPAVGARVSFTGIVGISVNDTASITVGELINIGFSETTTNHYTKRIYGDYTIKSTNW